MQFWKFHGTGNDFIMINNLNQEYILSQTQIQELCHRHTGIGADGLIELLPDDTFFLRMRYYNSDGHEGTMCGNGGRAFAAFADMHKVAPANNFVFSAIDGQHKALVLSRTANTWMISVKLNDVKQASTSFNDTGSPHHIEFVENINNVNILQQGKAIRHHKQYEPIGGVNVNFLEETKQGLHVRTYERGVEAETLSCGTGATASAVAFAVKNDLDSGPVNIDSKGGRLTVDFKRSKNNFYNIWLTAEVTLVFKGETYDP
ncbi:MAG: diaminopimelate epimerase [Bacteroidales bacterium]